MQKALGLVIFFAFLSLSAFAQSFYFDTGLGLGRALTRVDGENARDIFKAGGAVPDELAFDFSLKAGLGPFGNLPLYPVGEFAYLGHRIYNSSNYFQSNTFLIGPGLIFYLTPNIQAASSVGYSFFFNETNKTDMTLGDVESATNDGRGGFAWNVSVAIDLGGRIHGCLLGLKYFYANNTLTRWGVNEQTSMFGVFVKYTRRTRALSIF